MYIHVLLDTLEEEVDSYRLLRSFEGADVCSSSNCIINLYSKLSTVKEAEEIIDDLRERSKANEFRVIIYKIQ